MKKISLLCIAVLLAQAISAQENDITIRDRTITTAVPFLLIASDARAGGLGDQGVATRPDAYSQQWNPSKYAFIKQKQGVGVSYVPYLRQLVDDINIGQINYYNRITERSAFAGSFRYFNYGEIRARQGPNDIPLTLKPNQFSVDLSYALKLSDQISMAVTGRYLRSDLKLQTSNADASAANSFGVDISTYYKGERGNYGDFVGRWRAGANISNVGPKISYDDAGQESFIPTNLRLGGAFDFILDDANTITTSAEFSKLLVPTPSDSNNDGNITREDDWSNKGAFEGIFSSFGDAPGGLSEEIKEVTWSLAAEYWYEDSFAFRLGYFNESKDKGFRKYLTLGAGFRYNIIQIDLSYLFSTAAAVQSPLEGSLRFSLSFNLGDSY